MKILCLYNNECALELFKKIHEKGHEVVLWNEHLDNKWCLDNAFDLTVSYTYRFILSEEILESLNNNVVNIHNSILPWNRGADPNIWSIVDKTPRGVTLHYMDVNLDKGDIIAQKFVNDGDDETLKSSYNNLDKAAKELFMDLFDYYDYWQTIRKKCLGTGSYHSVKDGKKIKGYITSYDITINEFRQKLEMI